MSFTLKSHIPQLLSAVKGRAKSLVNQTALEIEVGVKTSMTEPKSGRIYRRKGKAHQASAPGESPAIDTTKLIKSLGIEQTGETSVAVGFTDKKSVGLELGTSRIAPRPSLVPAAEDAKEGFERGLKDLIE